MSGAKTARIGEHTVTIEVIEVNPDRATEILGVMGINRKLSSGAVERYKSEMLAGKWIQEAEPIKFNTEGKLIDGQHRLWAVIESGTTQKFIAIYGLPDESFMVLDTGRRRSFVDTISIHRPKARFLTSLAAATAVIRKWEQGSSKDRTGLYLRDNFTSNQDLWEFFEANEDELVNAVETGRVLYDYHRGAMSGRFWSLLVWVLNRVDQEDAEFFFEALRRPSIPVAEDSPIAAARDVLRRGIGERRSEADDRLIFLKLLKAWNFYRRGEPAKHLVYRIGGAKPEPFPEPI